MASTTSRAMPPARPMVFASEPVTLRPTSLSASAAPAALRMPVRIAVRPARVGGPGGAARGRPAGSQPASVDSHEKPPNSSFWRSRRDATDGAGSRRPPPHSISLTLLARRPTAPFALTPRLPQSVAVGLDVLLAELLGHLGILGHDVLV